MVGLIPIVEYFVVDIYCCLVVIFPTIHILIKSPPIVKRYVNCNHYIRLAYLFTPKTIFTFLKINLAIVFKLL